MGFRIFRHSVVLVFSQLAAALRISGLLYLIVALVYGLVVYLMAAAPQVDETPQVPWPLILVGLLACFLYIWIAVAWHRYVLLDEPVAGAVPPLLADRLLAYFGRGAQIWLLIFAGGFVAIFIVATLTQLVSPDTLWVLQILPIMAIAIFTLLGYRFAPLLPAAAIGNPIDMRAAWASTKGAWGSFILLTLISVVAAVVIDLPANLLGQSPQLAIPALIWFTVTTWVKLMVGASILTTIYGVYVEKRTIA